MLSVSLNAHADVPSKEMHGRPKAARVFPKIAEAEAFRQVLRRKIKSTNGCFQRQIIVDRNGSVTCIDGARIDG